MIEMDLRLRVCSCLVNKGYLFEIMLFTACDCLSQQPHICENVIVECAQLVRETVLESGPRETPLLDHPTVHRDIITLIHNVIVAFAQVSFVLLGVCLPLCLSSICSDLFLLMFLHHTAVVNIVKCWTFSINKILIMPMFSMVIYFPCKTFMLN